MIVDTFTVVPVTRQHFHDAAHFVENYHLGLRAADALHIAVAIMHAATLVTRDKKLARASIPLGLTAEFL